MKVKVKRLTEDAILPRQMTEGSAGMDLAVHEQCSISRQCRKLVGIGIAVSIPPGYEGQIRPRSGLANSHGVTVMNSPGKIDSDYRGEIKVLLINLGSMAVSLEKGLRIAQLVIAPIPFVELEEVEELDGTARGSGGFGSTGRS
jgi:dUTP pyrophosphatase